MKKRTGSAKKTGPKNDRAWFARKVAELKARITPGTYQVPGEAIAERMLTDDLLD